MWHLKKFRTSLAHFNIQKLRYQLIQVNQCKYLILFLYAYIASPLSFATLDCCVKLNDQTGVFLYLCGTLITQQLAQWRWQRETGISVMQVNA